MNPKTEAEAVKQCLPFVIKTAGQFKNASSDDLIQEGLLAVALAFREFREDGGASFLTWIRLPVRHAMLNFTHKNRKQGGTFLGGSKKALRIRPAEARTSSLDAPLSIEGDEDGETLHDIVGSFDEPSDVLGLERLPGLLVHLKGKQRELLRLRYVEGLTQDQVAKKLRRPRQAVASSEARALMRLKRLLSKGEREKEA